MPKDIDDFAVGSGRMLKDDDTVVNIANLLEDILTAASNVKIEADNVNLNTDGLEALLTTLNAKDFATQTTLAALLAKVIAAPSTEAQQTALAALVGEVQLTPTVYTLLGRLKSLEDKWTAGLQLSGSTVVIGAVTYVVSGGDTLRNTAANKPTAAAAHAVIPFCYYYSVDIGVVEVTTGAAWVVI